MNWKNITALLEGYTQHKHYKKLFDKYRFSKKNSRKEMLEVLKSEMTGLLEPVISQSDFEEWLALHQIDGNNHTFVYSLKSSQTPAVFQNLHLEKQSLISRKIWDIDPRLATEGQVIDDIELVGLHYDEERKAHIFSFVAPSEILGDSKDGQEITFKRLFFAHCAMYENSDICKIVFNPTVNLQNVCGMKKGKNHDWSPIAYMFFNRMRDYIGGLKLDEPKWISNALFRLAEDASQHNNPQIHEYSFRAEKEIAAFAEELLRSAGLDAVQDQAMILRLSQDIQQSFEAQLIEKYGVNEETDSFKLYRQRADGFTHVIDVESTEAGARYGASLKSGPAAQAAWRSRQDGGVELLGVLFSHKERNYKFIVEPKDKAFVIRSANMHIEEEVVNIVIDRLIKYRIEILSHAPYGGVAQEGNILPTT